MKKIIITSLVLFAYLVSDAQNTNSVSKPSDIVITPGIGIGSLKLGMSETEAYSILKGTISWKSYSTEMKNFKQFLGDNFAIDSVVQFVLGFDSCAAYTGNLPEEMPVFSLYFNKHKLNYITVTSYSSSPLLVKRVVLKNGIRFNNSMDECTAKMKSKFLSVNYKDYDGDYIYYKEGLEFTFDKMKLTTIGVFKPTPNFAQRIKDKTYDLKQEYGDID